MLEDWEDVLEYFETDIFFFLDKYPEFRDTGIYTLSLLTREGRMGILKKGK